MAQRPGGGRVPAVDLSGRPSVPARPLGASLGGSTLGGRLRINARRILLHAAETEWRSRAVRAVPPNQPIARTPDRCLGAMVVEVEPVPMPADDFWWYHVEVLAIDLPAAQLTPVEFFAVPLHQSGEAFPPPDRLPPVIALVRLVPAQFARWQALLDAPPYPALLLDPAAGTAQLELSDMA